MRAPGVLLIALAAFTAGFVVRGLTEPLTRSMLVAHEFTHQPLNHLINRSPALQAAIASAECAQSAIVDDKSYRGFRNYWSENVVRNLSYRMADVPDRDTGFLLEPMLGAYLRAYEANPAARLEDVLVASLAEVRARYCAQ